jgi:tRNA pseudouridine13 synthase
MSSEREIDPRPAKRARLDDNNNNNDNNDNAAPVLTPTPTVRGSALNAPSQIDSEQEREVRAGITEYVCASNRGFAGVLKQRYTDFLVNEIGLDGEVVHLKRLEPEKRERSGEGAGVAETTAGVRIEMMEENGEDKVVVELGGGAKAEEVKPVEEAKPVEETVEEKPDEVDGEEVFAVIKGDAKEKKDEVCIAQCSGTSLR